MLGYWGVVLSDIVLFLSFYDSSIFMWVLRVRRLLGSLMSIVARWLEYKKEPEKLIE